MITRLSTSLISLRVNLARDNTKRVSHGNASPTPPPNHGPSTLAIIVNGAGSMAKKIALILEEAIDLVVVSEVVVVLVELSAEILTFCFEGRGEK